MGDVVWAVQASIPGCTDVEACNYAPLALHNDGSCIHPTTGYGCDGECLEDINDNVPTFLQEVKE